ncbi:MAG: ribonuclease P protein component 1 [Candidatus Diapherotrites archaeon CG10_big_fil_rev_8_21_14_0_10_31_34]|nr:MAG: ribonuclease P protein component 1 [Candidatus Diapherotrites archaeon CG10_big_fil_rev_8_21_14_0_10_31_34]
MFEKKYAITQENVAMHEINGLKVKITKSNDKTKKISGKIIKETKNLLIIETKKGEKKIPKKEAEIEFELKGKKTKINGEKILMKPEDRIKMFWRKKND